MSDGRGKGEFKGKCNITVCKVRVWVQYYNHSTRKYYCKSCASSLNDIHRAEAMELYGHDLCTKMTEDGVMSKPIYKVSMTHTKPGTDRPVGFANFENEDKEATLRELADYMGYEIVKRDTVKKQDERKWKTDKIWVIHSDEVLELATESCYPPDDKGKFVVCMHKFSYETFQIGVDAFNTREEAEYRA